MQKFDEWQMPDGEEHLPEWMLAMNKRVEGRLTYQYHKYEAALKYVKQRRVCMDIGAHIGLWSWFMSHDFEDVAAFEPMPEHHECWVENMKDRANAECYNFALGQLKSDNMKIETRTVGSSGDTGVVDGKGGVSMRPLDHFCIPNVDLIKIDTEGYEYDILMGGLETLELYKPCVIVEQKGNMSAKYGRSKLAAVKLLQDMGAVLRAEISGDYILSWD